MNKKVMIGIGIIFAAVLFVIIAIIIPNNDNSKQIEFTYQSQIGVPYHWEYEIEDKNVAEFVKKYELDDKQIEGGTGDSLYTNYVFKGLKEGKTIITFKYINDDDGLIDKENKVSIKVDKNKNISLIGVPEEK